MGYVLAGALVLAIVALGLALITISARRHGRARRRASADPSYGAGLPGSDTAILAADPDAPLGDTTEHAGRQSDGETVADQDAERSGGSGRPVRGTGYAETGGIGERNRPRSRADDAHHAPPVTGGEGEGRRRI